MEAGATRNFMALKLAEEQAARELEAEKEEERNNPMKVITLWNDWLFPGCFNVLLIVTASGEPYEGVERWNWNGGDARGAEGAQQAQSGH